MALDFCTLKQENIVLDDTLKAQLQQYLGLLRQPIRLIASLDESETGVDMRNLLETIVGLSDKVTLDASGNDIVAAWFTAADGRGHVRMARSSDAGVSFAPPVEIDNGGAYGQVSVVLSEDGTAFVSWWRRAQDGAELAVRSVTGDGKLGEPRVIGRTRASRPDVPARRRSDAPPRAQP